VSTATYRVQIARDSLFSTLVVDDSTVADTSRYSSSGLTTNGWYYWRVSAKNGGGNSGWSSTWRFLLSLDDVAEEQGIPTVFSLSQNYPNPFNPSTSITYGLPHKSQVTLTVFNMLGQRVAVLDEGEREAGYYSIVFDGKRLASGMYLYRIQAGGFVQTRKLILMK
jgi:hypothetical protein